MSVLQYPNENVKNAGKQNHTREFESFAVIFGLRWFRINLLFMKLSVCFTDLQSLSNTFKKENRHDSMVQRLHFLARSELLIGYSPGKGTKPPKLLLHLERGLTEGVPPEDKDGITFVLGNITEYVLDGLNVEKILVDVTRYLTGVLYKFGNASAGILERKAAMHKVLCEGNQFCRPEGDTRIIKQAGPCLDTYIIS